jgi:hypothetical protein
MSKYDSIKGPVGSALPAQSLAGQHPRADYDYGAMVKASPTPDETSARLVNNARALNARSTHGHKAATP